MITLIENYQHVGERTAEYFCDDIQPIKSIVSYFLPTITVLLRYYYNLEVSKKKKSTVIMIFNIR